ncbi:mechanosensitive ion channel family protein [Geodermatophilus sp. YIM 151500]|uniref:mechanosensitive ion channel family protein n=1 Tax=Geodermatophilus sp. YIM 151500 TaxID=2984531 RepID=UPI0021E364BA|nr:mechanosensitive ion channel family protein [Geodermatophilus sp. YIM 151500]MCV2489918.1 mechanosensitive ion channel family protein [Geodermatophilus sp. YIM 151500]
MHFPTAASTEDDGTFVEDAITLAEGVQATAVFVAAILLAILLRRLLVKALDRDADRHAGLLIGRFLSILVVAVGLVYALDLMGVRIGPLVGALGVGGIALAFAAQDLLSNFIAGILLQIRRPFRVGEQISSNDHEGTVADVNLRTTVLRTYDGLVVHLPNAEVLKAAIVNYTRTPLSRTSITVGLGYETDLARVRDVLLEACRSADGVVADPPPEVWIETFGESTVDAAVRYWHAADIASRWRVRSEVAIAIKTALDREGITIAFPQRVLWWGREDPAATSGEG